MITKYEWAVRAVWDDGSEEIMRRSSERNARFTADHWNELRAQGGSVVTCTVLRRTVTTGDWHEAPAWLGTVLETCIRDVATGRIARHSSVTDEMVAEWRQIYEGRS